LGDKRFELGAKDFWRMIPEDSMLDRRMSMNATDIFEKKMQVLEVQLPMYGYTYIVKNMNL
jgi:hypothetical protein